MALMSSTFAGYHANMERKQYISTLENAYRREQGRSISLLVSLSDSHANVASLLAPDDEKYPLNSNAIPQDLVDLAVAHLRVLHHFRQPGVEHAEQAVNWQVAALKAAASFVQNVKGKNWPVPVLITLAKDLRRLTFMLMKLTDSRGSAVRDEEETSKHNPYSKASDTIMVAFRICAADGRTADNESKRVGMMGLVNQMIRIYSKGELWEMYRPLIRALDPFSTKMTFPVGQMVTYRYFVGQKLVFDGDFRKAAEYLTYAFERCLKTSVANKRKILMYLLPAKMILGQMPKLFILKKYNLEQFEEVVLAVKQGNVRRLKEALETHQDFFVENGIYLILDKLSTLTFRNLFKKISMMFGTHQIDIGLYVRALRYLGMHDMEDAEAQCMIANLIDEGRIKGYLSLVHNKLVVSKTNPFPMKIG
ncbi:unnamed protein product [Notodromas monacha]|uniref:CSN12-like protein n=1 Tax=Notodromas monacha TaxID=399045 RepID=A0A7R9BZS7_9CRUS|nr:unnamed protein product [Notodromas monacha]CAG0923690.1 unnamed protein product [Notodromas monacha]